jgi:Na+-transporting methylmalonyl-CoA/oxaloacetate decarboxylase beta subunit
LQIKLVHDFSWVDAKKLDMAPELLCKVFSGYYKELSLLPMIENRIAKITELFKERVVALKHLADMAKAPEPEPESRGPRP